MRYYLSTGDGQTYGPYDVQKLRAMQAEGRVPPAAQLCQEGSTSWLPSGQILAGGAPSAPPPYSAPVAGGFTPVSFVGPILVTLLCCLPGGIVSLVYASSANTKGATGDFAGATAAAKASKTWLIVSMVTGFIGTVVWLGLVVLAGIAENS